MKLADLFKHHRATTSASLRTLAEEIGIPHTVLHRIEQGYDCDIPTFTKILTWMMKP